MLKKRSIVLSLVVFAVVLASVSVGAAPPKIEHPLDPEQYINTYLVANPSTLDPSLRSDAYSSTILINTMEGLIRMEERDGEYYLNRGDAYKWEANEDGTVWTFYLKGNKWEDGQPVTAHDYVYSLRRSSHRRRARPTATSSPPSRTSLKSTPASCPWRNWAYGPSTASPWRSP